MALKKSDLYSSIWASCDELRGGMDASQYKDYVLFMLFIKYVSDKYSDYDGFEPPIVIPTGASFTGATFKDMVALTGDPDIGDKINTQVIQPLIDANTRLARADFPDFNDPNKLGDGQTRVERLGNLIAIFTNLAPIDRTYPQRAIPQTHKQALPGMARGKGRAERVASGRGVMEAIGLCTGTR
jgi:type I restriction enzyme M protein